VSARTATLRLALSLISLAGCAKQPVAHAPAASVSLGDAIARDATRMLELLTPGSLGLMLIWIALTLAAVRMLNSVVEVLRRSGFDARRKLGAYVGGAQVTFVGVLLYAIVARIVGTAPVLGSLLLCVLVPTLVVIGAPGLQDLVAGISILVSRQFREGDHLRIGGHTGIVKSRGLTQVELGAHDGSTVILPARLVTKEAVVVDHVRNSVAVTATIDVGREAVPTRLDLLRRTAWLSPYRSPGTTVDVALESEGAARVVIQVSPRAKREASAHLMSSLEECMRDAHTLVARPSLDSLLPPRG